MPLGVGDAWPREDLILQGVMGQIKGQGWAKDVSLLDLILWAYHLDNEALLWAANWVMGPCGVKVMGLVAGSNLD